MKEEQIHPATNSFIQMHVAADLTAAFFIP